MLVLCPISDMVAVNKVLVIIGAEFLSSNNTIKKNRIEKKQLFIPLAYITLGLNGYLRSEHDAIIWPSIMML